MATEEALAKLEKEMKILNEELEVSKEAKTTKDACAALCDYSEREQEPFSTSYNDVNEWHKSAGGSGACVIL